MQLGIQNEYTGFVSLNGPDSSPIPVNADISFNWDFDGFGKQYCWIGGCMSGLTGLLGSASAPTSFTSKV